MDTRCVRALRAVPPPSALASVASATWGGGASTAKSSMITLIRRARLRLRLTGSSAGCCRPPCAPDFVGWGGNLQSLPHMFVSRDHRGVLFRRRAPNPFLGRPRSYAEPGPRGRSRKVGRSFLVFVLFVCVLGARALAVATRPTLPCFHLVCVWPLHRLFWVVPTVLARVPCRVLSVCVAGPLFVE